MQLLTDVQFWRGIYLTVKNHFIDNPSIYFYRFSADDVLNLNKIVRKETVEGKTEKYENATLSLGFCPLLFATKTKYCTISGGSVLFF